MKRTLIGVLAVLMATAGLWACGSEEEVVLTARTAIGTVGGCQVENHNPNLRVGVFGQTATEDLIEVVSVGIDTYNPQWQLLLDMEITEDVAWVVEGDGVTRRTELLVLAYIDSDESSTYDEDEDGFTVGSAERAIYYFDQSYSEKNAVYGFNLSVAGGGYTQDFAGNPMYIAAGGCN
jgi:hypothetical protein